MLAVQDALPLHIWLREEESVWVRDCNAIEIDTTAAPEAEADPELLLDVSIVEGEIH